VRAAAGSVARSAARTGPARRVAAAAEAALTRGRKLFTARICVLCLTPIDGLHAAGFHDPNVVEVTISFGNDSAGEVGRDSTALGVPPKV
jgi:hypothetical protein